MGAAALADVTRDAREGGDANSPSAHGEVRDGVVVGLEDLGIVEHLVSERVEPVQGHADVCGGHPFLQKISRRRKIEKLTNKTMLWTKRP